MIILMVLRHWKIVWVYCLFFLGFAALSYGELKIDSVFPSLGTIGQDLEITVTGFDFDGETRATLSLDTMNSYAIVGSTDVFGEDIAIKEDVAFVASEFVTGEKGFAVIEISDPYKPTTLHDISSMSPVNGLSIDGNTLLLATEHFGLQIWDIENPKAPGGIGNFQMDGNMMDVFAFNKKAYALNNYFGLVIIDISNTKTPQLIDWGIIDEHTTANDIKVANNFAFIASESGIQILDVANPELIDPTSPNLTKFPTRDAANSLILNDKMAFVGDQSGYLYILDVSNPENPLLMSEIDLGGPVLSLAGLRDQVYVVCKIGDETEIRIVDTANPYDPKLAGALSLPSQGKRIAIANNFAYTVGKGFYSVELDEILNVSEPNKPNLIGSFKTNGWTNCIEEKDGVVYVGEWEGTLFAFDSNDSIVPKAYSQLNNLQGISGIFLDDNKAYLSAGWDVHVVDATDWRYLSLLGSSEGIYSDANDIWVKETAGYVAESFGSDFRILDMSIPSTPIPLNSFGGFGALQTYIDGNTGFFLSLEGLDIFDVTDPFNPTHINTILANGSNWDNFFSWAGQDMEMLSNQLYLLKNKLFIYDMSNPYDPVLLSRTGFFGSDIEIQNQNNIAYIASEKIQAIDISHPKKPILMGSVDTPGSCKSMVIKGDIAYVADGYAGVSIVPLPTEIDSLSQLTSTSLNATLPSPRLDGTYNLRVFNSEGDFYEIPGAVTFVEPDSPRLTAKAIIVAGKGPEDTVWPETKMVADYAYRTLKMQGFTDERIQFLSADTTADGVDAYANPANLSSAITTWGQDASGLFVYFVGHGEEETFFVNPAESVSAGQLDGWLDQLQAAMLGQVFFVYDACRSGSFLPHLAPAENRVVITSGSNEKSWLFNYGHTSFSYKFWDEINENANVARAFEAAGRMMAPFQTANLDANGDGRPNDPEDISYIATELIGRGRIIDRVPSPIGAVSPPITLNGSASATIWADISPEYPTPIESVRAIAIVPNDGLGADPVEATLADPEGDGRFEADFSAFSEAGAYLVGVYVLDAEGNLFHDATYVTQTGGTSTAEGDRYEPDDAPDQAAKILVGDSTPQSRNFHRSSDEDRVRFFAVAGETYEIRAMNLTPACGARIELYAADGATLLAERNIRPVGGDEALYWTFDAEGVYFARIVNINPAAYGETVRYDLEIIQPYLSDAGIIQGQITDSQSYPVHNARIKTDGGGGNLSRNGGDYMLRHRTGDFTLTVEADGYLSKQVFVSLEKSQVLSEDLVLSGDGPAVLPGDVNNDGEVDLADAVMALQVVAGREGFNQALYLQADVDGDDKIGLEEALFALREIMKPWEERN